MEEKLEMAAVRAISTMRKNLGEPLTIDDIARSAMFSKFHFTRIFQRATGVSPGRFLSALRIQKAQQLLVSTSLHVADISQRVGYNSVGTFSTRFSKSVGMSPTSYRRHSGFAIRIITDSKEQRAPAGGRITCRVSSPHDDQPRMVFAGLFQERIPQGRPARCAVLTQPGLFALDDVPCGTWFLLAQSVPGTLRDSDGYCANLNEAVSVASQGPIVIRQGSDIPIDLTFSSARALDPPVLLALLDVRKLAMRIRAERDPLMPCSEVRIGQLPAGQGEGV